MTESVIAKTRATTRATEGQHGLEGTLVLTTERVYLLVDDEIRYEARRSEIVNATQHHRDLYIWRRTESPGLGFRLDSMFAGPARWDWYLQPPSATHPLRDRLWANANDARVGPVDDETRRATVARWQEMFDGGTISSQIHFLDDTLRRPLAWKDIVEIVYIVDGEPDGPNWVFVARNRDGRWQYFTHISQITGEVYSILVVASSLEDIWWGAFTEDERDRLTSQMTQERLDEELVKLDSLLESTDENLRRHAEYRMQQIRLVR